MDDEAFRVADVREETEELPVRGVYDLAGLGASALHSKHYHSAGTIRKILLRKLRLGERRILHPRDLRMRLQVQRHEKRILAVLRDAERQRLDSLEEYPRGVRRERRTLVADSYSEQANRKRDWLERIR